MAVDTGRLPLLLRWCGLALIAAGVLMVGATLLHPSRETATTIVATEPRLVAAHVVYTLAWLLVLLGLPGLYAAHRGGMGRLGLVGLLTAFSGTYLSGDHQWVGSDLVHDRLHSVRYCHDQDRDIASLVRRAGRCGRSGAFAGFRDGSAGLDRRVAD